MADNENKEVRELGTKLGVPEHLIFRHPFPGPSLGIRVLGEVTPSQLRIAREADRIFIDEIIAAITARLPLFTRTGGFESQLYLVWLECSSRSGTSRGARSCRMGRVVRCYI